MHNLWCLPAYEARNRFVCSPDGLEKLGLQICPDFVTVTAFLLTHPHSPLKLPLAQGSIRFTGHAPTHQKARHVEHAP
jgi:hypothetical protein